MKRVKVHGSNGIFLKKITVRCVILLTVAICVLSLIAGVVYTKANGRITLLSTTTTEVETITQPVFNEPEIQTEPEHHGQWQTVKMRVTAYCPCEKCCGQYSDGITACGHRICPGDAFVAAGKEYPFGTEMIVPGYENGQTIKVLDRGGAIYGDRLDVFFHSHQQALEWGVKYLNIKVHRALKTQ